MVRLVPEKQNRLSWRPWAKRRRACPPSALQRLPLAPRPGWSSAVPDPARLAGRGARCRGNRQVKVLTSMGLATCPEPGRADAARVASQVCRERLRQVKGSAGRG